MMRKTQRHQDPQWHDKRMMLLSIGGGPSGNQGQGESADEGGNFGEGGPGSVGQGGGTGEAGVKGYSPAEPMFGGVPVTEINPVPIDRTTNPATKTIGLTDTQQKIGSVLGSLVTGLPIDTVEPAVGLVSSMLGRMGLSQNLGNNNATTAQGNVSQSTPSTPGTPANYGGLAEPDATSDEHIRQFSNHLLAGSGNPNAGGVGEDVIPPAATMPGVTQYGGVGQPLNYLGGGQNANHFGGLQQIRQPYMAPQLQATQGGTLGIQPEMNDMTALYSSIYSNNGTAQNGRPIIGYQNGVPVYA